MGLLARLRLGIDAQVIWLPASLPILSQRAQLQALL